MTRRLAFKVAVSLQVVSLDFEHCREFSGLECFFNPVNWSDRGEWGMIAEERIARDRKQGCRVDGADVRLNERADEIIEDLRSLRRPRVFVISGPSGVGKDAVIQEMRVQLPDFHYAVTATTRQRRPGEIDGVHYHFMEADDFKRLVEEGEFLEHATVYGNLYGVPKQRVRSALASGRSVVIKVDVQGARTIREIIPQAVLIFLVPPSMSELLHRLRDRKSDDFDVVIQRLNTATQELTAASEFDYLVFNETDRLADTVESIATIVNGEEYRIDQREVTL